MKKIRWHAREPKQLLQLTPEQKGVLKEWTAKTWKAIGELRGKRGYATDYKPWDPCLAAQRNYVAWCYSHNVNPLAWDNFVYYFGMDTVFWEPVGTIASAHLPSGMSIAAWELGAATGTDPRSPYLYFASKHPKCEVAESYHDTWNVVLTVTDKEGAQLLKKKLVVEAKSWPGSRNNGPTGPRWTVSYQNDTGYFWPRFESRTEITFREPVSADRSFEGYHSRCWWLPVLRSIKGELPTCGEYRAQVQPQTYRRRHEIHGLTGRYYD